MSVVGGRRREDFIKYSFDFDGTDEFFSGSTTYTELDGQSKCTISAWIKAGSLSSTSYLFGIGGSTTLFQVSARLQSTSTTNAKVWFYINNSINSERASADLGAIKNDGQWHHLMICMNLTDFLGINKVDFFLDGNVLSKTGNYQPSVLANSGTPLNIGNRENPNTGLMVGAIDELAIWSGSDLRENINEIYNNGVPNYLNNLPSVPPPTNWFRMGELSQLNGTQWTMTDVNGGYTVLSESMDENNRVLDTP